MWYSGLLPTVDVGIPIHNGFAFLDRAINSVISQEFEIANLILINDGSTDNSHEVILHFTNVLSNSGINVISSSHSSARGIASTYNEICQLSSSDYLLILDQDDFLLPDFFKNLQLFKGSVDQIRVGSWTSNSSLIKYASSITRIFGWKVRLPKNLPILGSITTRAAVLYPVPLLKQIPFPLGDLPGADVEHLNRLRQKAICWFYPRSTVFYQIHSGSTSKKDSIWKVPSDMGFLYKADNQIRSLIRKLVRQ